MSKLRVGVLMGGKSIEKEVSFNSGRTICDHLDSSRYEIIPLFQQQSGQLYILPWRFLHRGKISDFEHRLHGQATQITWDALKKTVDFVYLALHGRFGEDGTVQGFLELLGIPYLGAKVFASSLGMDKIIQKDFLRMNNIDVPRDIVVKPQEINNYRNSVDDLVLSMQHAHIGFPCIVKPHKEGSSFGISVVKKKEDLYQALIHASFVNPNKPQSVLIEEKISGMEFTCIILTEYTTGQPLFMPPTEVVHDPQTDFYDYEQKYMPGKALKITPARCTQEQTLTIQQTCLKVMYALEMTNIARIDGFLTEDGKVVIIDPNTLTGMGPASFLFKQAAEINMGHSRLINHVIETELAHYGMLSPLIDKEQQRTNMNENKLRVAVLLGGASNEKEISLESGRNIVYKLSPQKYDVLPIFVSRAQELYKLNQSLLVSSSTQAIEQRLHEAEKIEWNDLSSIADFAFIALHGGAGENGEIQGTLEMLGLAYNGSSVFASALCIDKFKTNTYLATKGFDVPRSLLIHKSNWQSNSHDQILAIEQAIHYPIIVKPHDDGCSVLVSKANNSADLEKQLNILFEQKNYALVEECIIGMELTVGVIGNNLPQALPPSQAVANKGILSIEEKFLPGAGENQTPAPLPDQTLSLVKKVVEDVYATIGCKGYARIDCFYQDEQQSSTGNPRVVILEINSLPGLTPATVIFHQAAELGIKPMDFLDMIIQLGCDEHKKTAIQDMSSEEQILKLLKERSLNK